MSTKTIEVVGRGSGWQKVGIELGSFFFYPNSSQPGMFQTFAVSTAHCTKAATNPEEVKIKKTILRFCVCQKC